MQRDSVVMSRYINKPFDRDLNVLRALAALLVFCWHYLHHSDWNQPEDYWTIIPLLSEGHVGVSLFMLLSGYLFTSILYNSTIRWGKFAINRAVRILPLLFVTQLLWLVMFQFGFGQNPISNLLDRLIHSELVGGAWSIVTEIHYYILLPPILLALSLSRKMIVPLLIGAILIEIYSYYFFERDYTYHSIAGRFGQFMIGSACYLFFDCIKKQNLCVFVFGTIGFFIYLMWFDLTGGHLDYLSDNKPLASIRFFIEGLGFAFLFFLLKSKEWHFKNAKLYSALSYVGDISYSLYLVHFFVLAVFFKLSQILLLPTDFYYWSLFGPVLLITVFVSSLSYHWIEHPFLLLRKNYIESKNRLM